MIDFEYQQKAIKISLTPLIDIVFILLVFFMLVTSFLKWNAITLSSHVPIDEINVDKKGTLLIITAPDSYEIDGRTVSLEEAEAILKSKLDNEPGHSLLIQTKDGIALQELVNVMTYMKKLMGNNISIAKYESEI